MGIQQGAFGMQGPVLCFDGIAQQMAAMLDRQIDDGQSGSGSLRAGPGRHLSNVLSRNEANRDYTYNRRLFKRLTHGYQFNPALSIRRRGHDDDSWQPVFAALNLPLVHELAYPDHWPLVSSLWTASGGATLPVPIAGENWWKREEALLEEARQHAERLRQAEGQRRAAQAKAAPWGTPQAKRAEIERVRREIESRRLARGETDDA